MMQDLTVFFYRHLATFKTGLYGEARLYYRHTPNGLPNMENVYSQVSKSQLSAPLPTHLSGFEKWLPAFKLMDGIISYISVVFRPKNSASARDIGQWQEQQATISPTWWQTILIPAIDSLPTEEVAFSIRN